MSKEIFVLLAILFSKQRIDAPLFVRYRKLIVGIPLLFTIMGCTFAAAQEINPVGAIMTIRSMLILPIGASLCSRILSFRIVWPAFLTITICLFINVPIAITQFYSPSTSWINSYVGGSLEGVASTGFSDRIRATGTFSYITGLGMASILGVSAGIIALAVTSSNLVRILGMLGIASGLTLALATVSRGPILLCLALLGLALLILSRKYAGLLIVGLFATLVFAPELYHVFTSEDSPEFTSAVFLRSKSADQILERVSVPFYDLYDNVLASPLGNGLGIGQTATRKWESGRAVIESEWARIVFEIGIFGFLGFTLTYLGAIYVIFSASRGITNKTYRTISIFIIVLLIGLLWTGVAFNHVTSAFFWLVFAATLFLIDSIHFNRHWFPHDYRPSSVSNC